MAVSEEIYRYPRRITIPVEALTAAAVTLAMLWVGRNLLRALWAIFGLDQTLVRQIPALRQIVSAINAGIPLLSVPRSLTSLLAPLAWLLLTLLLALVARNARPTIRTSPRGMLVEFAGSWLAVPWESLKSIKVTEDGDAKRYVLLAEADPSRLTGWHRCYSFLYRLGFSPGFLITSSISNFDSLVKALLSETDRVARALDNVKPAQLQEGASSPLFRFLLSPATFFGRSKAAPAATASAAPASPSDPIRGVYPARITNLLGGGAALLLIVGVVLYIISWMRFLALLFTDLLRLPLFDRLTLLQRQADAPWWVLVSGHLTLLALVGVALLLRNLLPMLEARREGLAVFHFSRWIVVPWARIVAIKETRFSDDNVITLVQTKGSLPFSARLRSLLYDGSLTPGIPIASAIGNFDALIERIVTESARHQAASAVALGSPIMQTESPSTFLMLSFRAGPAIDTLVEESRTLAAKALPAGRLAQAATQMAMIALIPSLMLFADRSIALGVVPSGQLVVVMVVLLVLGMLEWPLISLGAQLLDDATGGGEEGNRPFLLYPQVQLPRILPMLGALLMVLIGVPVLPVLLWIAAIFWSFLLAAGLWEALYSWSGTQLLAGGLVPVLFQLIVLLVYLLLFR